MRRINHRGGDPAGDGLAPVAQAYERRRASAVGVSEVDPEVRGRLERRRAIRPLHELKKEGVPSPEKVREVVAQRGRGDAVNAQNVIYGAVGIRNAIEIDVIHRAATHVVRLDERVGRTRHGALVTQSVDQRPGQRRFAATEFAGEQEHPAADIVG